MVSNIKMKIVALSLLVTILTSVFPFQAIVFAVNTTDCIECENGIDCDNCDDETNCNDCDDNTDCDDCNDNRDCGDDTDCDIDETYCETCEEETECLYSVVSPVGYGTIEMITQAKRLDTLEGKNIALVGGSFNAAITYSEIKKCIQEEYPTANVYILSEVGSGGVYSPKKPSNQTVNFQNKLKELNIDAVVSGNCGCGLCTVKETGSSIAAEYIGIPTVTVGAPSFIAEIKSTGTNRGVPVLRTAEYPGAFSSDTKEELQKNAREVLWPQIKEGLTNPISAEEIQQGQPEEVQYDEIVYSGCYDCVQDYFKMNEWTDGNPIVPPTDEKIQEYLKYTPYRRADATIVASIAPSYRKATAYTVAANAVMAGCPEEYMPLCIAFTRCLADKDFAQTLSSTHGWTPYAWINGPIARQLGIDANQMSEENNKALARFIELSMLNLAGYYVKDNRMGTFGYLSPWTFSEDEEACLEVGWEPYHVTQGMDLNSNALTAGSALQWGNSTAVATSDAEEIMNLIAFDITEKGQNGLGTTNPQVYRTIFVTEAVAKNLAKGYSKDSLEDALISTARRPLWLRTYANYWGNTGSIQSLRKTLQDQYNKLLVDPAEQAGETETPVWLKKLLPNQDRITTIATMNKGETPILITGNSTASKVQVMPGGAYKTIEIVLPDNWDELMAEKGYEPLSSFYLGENQENQKVNTTKVTNNGTDCDDCDDKIDCDDCGDNSSKCSYSVVSPVGNSNKTVYSGCYDCVQEYFKNNGWTDGAPIVPPTDEKVQEYLEYTPYNSQYKFGPFAENNKKFTTYTVAVNAVMAGCPAEYMPLCIAFTKCLEDEEWIESLMSTDGWTPYAWINGPIARQLGIDHEQGMISEENNKALARFIELAMLNIGGYDNRTDTFGYLSPWTFSEDEETCLEIGWQPYHVVQGMKLNSNAITASAALQWGNSVTPATDDAEEIMKLMAFDITEKQENGLGTTNPQVYRTMFITKPVAEDLAKVYASKDSLEDTLVSTARRPLWLRTYASYFGSGSNKSTLLEHYEQLLQDPDEQAEMTETPAWLKNLLPDQDEIMTVATMNKGETPILVTGDYSRNKIQAMPGAGYKTVEIELPDNWDKLMAEKGYEPLKTFYLGEDEEDPGDPGEENPGEENPGEENPGEENPGEENPEEENPEEENPGEENPGEENPGEENPGDENPGEENPDEDKPGDNTAETGDKNDGKDDSTITLTLPKTGEANYIWMIVVFIMAFVVAGCSVIGIKKINKK